jgi:photosystem II stability/assembly factor-like uncharacterized protein
MKVIKETLLSLSAKAAIALIALASIANLVYAQIWVAQNSGTNNQLHSVWFTDSQTGWTVGDFGTSLRTVNGGNTWSPVVLTNEDLHDVAFLNASTGLIVGDNGIIFRTVNGGTNWPQVSSGTGNNLETVCFGANGMAYIAGRNGTILRSSDNGSSWIVAETGAIRYRGSAARGMRLYIVGDGGVIIASTNGGITRFLQSSGTNSDLHTVYFVSELEGWIGGQNNTVLYTNNGGVTWISRNSGINVGIDGIFFLNTLTGCAVGNAGNIFVSLNGGISWTPETSNTTHELEDVFFPDGSHGWAVGNSGTIRFRGGPLGITQTSSEIPDNFSLSQNYPNPFNPGTTLEFQVAKYGFVKLAIFDILGREAAVLVNEKLQPGIYEIYFDGTSFQSGVYFYRMITNEYSESKKMILVK